MSTNLITKIADDSTKAPSDRVAVFPKRRFLWVLTPLALLSFALVHLIWPFTLPVPWNDESSFIIPPINFLLHHNFNADQMMVHQIFWMPFHLYFVNGILFSLLHSFNLHLSRALSFAFVTLGALFLRSAVGSLLTADRTNPAIGNGIVAAWYISIPMVFCADLMRPDALSVCLSVATIALALQDRYLASFGLACACVATHPLEALPAVGVAACVLPLLRLRKPLWWEWLLLLWGASLLAFDAGRDLSNFNLYKLHMQLQVGNKAAHFIPPYTWGIPFVALVFLVWFLYMTRSLGQSGRLRSSSRLVLVFLYTTLCLFVTSYAQEMWYFVWEFTAFPLAGAIAINWLQFHSPGLLAHKNLSPVFTRKLSLAIGVFIFCSGLATWLPGFRPRGIYGFLVKPTNLSQIRDDQIALRTSLISNLSLLGASHVLLPPALYGQFVSNKNSGAMEFMTWNPFSKPFGRPIDYAVVITKGYPSARTETSMPAVIAQDNCSPKVKISTPNNYYKAEIVAVSADRSAGPDIKTCATLRFDQR